MLRNLATLPDSRAAFARLRMVQTYGEPLMKDDVAALAQMLPAGCFVRSTYGSTEASGLAWFAGAPEDYDPIRVASGNLLPDTAASVVDDEGLSCSPGESGELLIRSRYNALGEWIDGAPAHGRLALHPSGDGTRVFRTGDIARYHPDGVFVVLGRKDRMLNINGQRLEPAEIEAVLRRIHGVERGEVVVQSSGAGVKSPRLIAFIVAAAGVDAFARAGLVSRTRTALRAALPEFMVPYRILEVPAIPLLPGGKIDSLTMLAIADEMAGMQPAVL